MGVSFGKLNRNSNEGNLDEDQLINKVRYTPLTPEKIDHLEKNYSNEMRKPFYLGYITSAEATVPEDPQLFAAATPDPTAPFAFNQGIQWESYYYDDGSIFEGTMTENFPHGKGIISLGYMGGGGLLTGATSEEMQVGDLYEGEFNMGFAHGMGKIINRDGFVYTGEFMAGLKHGCGELKDLSSYLRRLQLGLDPLEAWKASIREIEATKREGTWLNDYFSELPDKDYIGTACTPTEIAGVLEEVDEVANKTRLFRYKPDGMAQIFYQEAKGIPVKTLQDPLHYPFGTTFLAPGPIAQLFPIPDDASLKNEMRRAQNLWRSIYDKYNYDPDPDCDSSFFFCN
eukprot:gnl/TRDRNA2_/TRDRNA2_173725_c0_seq1.p1 gnl/TRDRNA2_/TRDRNA2_173725_c0~~gnl/TRDRNA2_/TRDRNA2_173725_c0_seq1.p1  ORF type:complete len:342 (-),score=-9.04 gnl/TRDRNA2_/TRDRNA2_173725_c0_seq1:215-1240(-)